MSNIQEEIFTDFNFTEGLQFGSLTLTGVHFLTLSNKGFESRRVVAKCKCGVVTDYNFLNVYNGKITSCHYCNPNKKISLTTSQYHSKHPLYDIWWGIKKRCLYESCANYEQYGGRGIAICDEWLNDYFSFYNWCIENNWAKGLQIDRIDNDGHYEPLNCRWVSRHDNLRNTSRNINITAWAETKCLSDWALDPRCANTYQGLRHRNERGKWKSMEDMISAPPVDLKEVVRKDGRMIEAWGIKRNMSQWLRDSRCLVKRDSLRDRLNAGWEPEKAIGTPASRDGKNSK